MRPNQYLKTLKGDHFALHLRELSFSSKYAVIINARDVGNIGPGWAIANPGLGRSVKQILTKGGILCPKHYYLPTRL